MSTQIQVNSFFTPTQISGCQLWLDAADTSTLTLSGTNVTQWRDKSGKNFTASNSGAVTTRTLNGQNAIYMPQTQMNISNFSQTVYSTTFFVANAQAANFILALGGYNTYVFVNNYGLYYFNNGVNSIDFKDSINAYGVPVVSANANFIFSIGYGGGTNTSLYNVNGTQRATVTTSGTAVSNTTLTNTLYINANPSGSIRDNTLLGELIVYNAVLTLAQAQQVEGYLAWKWGLQANLPSTHPYKSSPFPPLLNPPRTLANIIQSVWSPTQISGCKLWLDAAGTTNFTLSGTTVTQWNDKSGNAYNCTVSSGANGPTYVSSTNTVQFRSASSQALSIAQGYGNALVNVTCSTFIVGTRRTSTTFNYFVHTSSGGTGEGPNVGFNGDAMGIDFYNILLNPPSYYFTAAIPAYAGATEPMRNYEYMMNPTTFNLLLNGTNLGTLNSTQRATSFTNPQMGRRYAGPYHDFDINEMITYVPAISASDRQLVEGYLAFKWGMQANLPSNHPYRSSKISPTVAISAIWAPTRISGCSLWLDGADSSTIVLSGSKVTSWTDKTNGYVFSQTTDDNRPSYIQKGLNGQNYLQFAQANSQYLAGPTTLPIGTNSVSMFAVFSCLNNSDMSIFNKGGLGGATGRVQFWRASGLNSILLGITGSGTDRIDFVDTTTLNTFQITEFIHDRATSLASAYQNGTFKKSGAADPTTNYTTNTQMGVGAYGNASGTFSPPYGFYMNGGICEILIYFTSLSTSQREQVEGYLAWKWGLQGSLPSNHPWKNWPPAP